ncbi:MULTISPECIES: PH domain-containing protein [Oceanobacillus]|uniref:Uncharacterized protein YyaB-like PH domain-containing protein n=1 Tax=Oceanobacillus kimchii TaxID=746691 RepID=A0ABQ5TMB4_9BACI|nr:MULTISPECIES: PH domain-containing protein [Oceanobacillus]MBT2599730.1 PH domain-containing protein [Oceanobacillus sp. ISL-74]GLO67959.1 hypothetical protein MACH08_37430 [Oceanobacillus kimchii]
MVFASRKDIWIGVMIWAFIILFIWILYQCLFVDLDILGITLMGVMIYLLGSIWFNTRYKIDNDTLRISFGPIKQSIDINEIKSIRNTKNLFVGPCLSIHRVEIMYGNYKVTQISPRDIQRLMKELEKNNPDIQVNT